MGKMIDMVAYFEFMNIVDSGEFDFLYKYGLVRIGGLIFVTFGCLTATFLQWLNCCEHNGLY